MWTILKTCIMATGEFDFGDVFVDGEVSTFF